MDRPGRRSAWPRGRRVSALDWLLPQKFIHIASAIVAVGANVTYAYWLRLAGNDMDRLTYTISAIRGLDSRVANPSSAAYRAAALRSNLLGMLTIAIVVIILVLMVFKPG